MKRRYTVYTNIGDYTGIWAYSFEEAEKQVWRLTYGRAKDIVAVLEV